MLQWYCILKCFQFFFQFFLGRTPTSTSHFFCPFVHLIPYLRSHTLSDYNFWYTCKMMISLGFFFHFFLILIFCAVMGLHGQKINQRQNEKLQLHLPCAISQEKYSIYHDFCYTCVCKMMVSPYVSFIFFKI